MVSAAQICPHPAKWIIRLSHIFFTLEDNASCVLLLLLSIARVILGLYYGLLGSRCKSKAGSLKLR
jgi:hypothetical protein